MYPAINLQAFKIDKNGFSTLISFGNEHFNNSNVIRVAEVVRGHRRHPPKSLDSDENFKPEHTLFCRELRFVAIYALFGDLWAKKCLFGSKTVFLGQEVHYYMVYIAYFTELILQICDYAQKRRI